jgi:hypothetical protein
MLQKLPTRQYFCCISTSSSSKSDRRKEKYFLSEHKSTKKTYGIERTHRWKLDEQERFIYIVYREMQQRNRNIYELWEQKKIIYTKWKCESYKKNEKKIWLNKEIKMFATKKNKVFFINSRSIPHPFTSRLNIIVRMSICSVSPHTMYNTYCHT